MSSLLRLSCMLAVALFVASVGRADEPKKKEKDPDEGKKGTVTGVVTAKDDNNRWIEVKADGEEKARRYVPYYRQADKGFDKEVTAKIKETPLKARVRIEWSFQERPRVEKIEVLKKDEK